jgi:phosphonate transport system substrate-binding protein
MNILKRLLTVLCLLTLVTLAFGQDCPRGDLLEPFCDVNGDMVADPPTDPAQFIDPDVLIFSYTPVEDPAIYREAWQDFLVHLSEMTGKEVQFFTVENYAAQLEALRAGRLHVAGVNTGSVPFVVNVAGFVPFAIMAGPNGEFGYEMEIIVHRDSDIETLEDIRGRQLAFVSPTSNSGFKAPTALLEAEFGMLPDEDYETAFSGRHDNSILGVANLDYEAAAIANSVLRRMINQGVVNADEIRTIYTSQTFPTTGYGHLYNLEPELAANIREAFFTFDWSGTGLEREFGQDPDEPRSKFMPITYLEHWEVIRTIDQISGVVYR